MSQPNYGFTQEPQGPNVQVQVVQGNQGNGLAVAGMVLGIIGLLFSWIPFFGWVMPLLALIFGAVGTSKAGKIGGKGKGMAIAGLVLGLIGIIIGALVFIAAMRVKGDVEDQMRRDGWKGEITLVHQLDRA